MNKTLVTILVLLVLVFGGYFLLRGDDVAAPLKENPENNSEVAENNPLTADETGESMESLVNYENEGYSPSTLTVKRGSIVTWKNNSQSAMWTASSMHPTHKDYPTEGGCLGSTFDACTGIQPGGSWSFKFDVVGEWKYHNHVVGGRYGTIVVIE